MSSFPWQEIKRLVRRMLTGVNYLLTVAVSIIVTAISVVMFLSLVDDTSNKDEPVTVGITTTTTSAAPSTPAELETSSWKIPSITTNVPNCVVAEPDPGDGNRNIRVFFSCGDDDYPLGSTWVYRQIPEEGKLFEETIKHLVAGPTVTERRNGFRSLFSPATADALLNASRRRGAVVIDLRYLGLQPSLTSGKDAESFLAALNNTVFQHNAAQSIEYRIEGSCEVFWSYLSEQECQVVKRSNWSESKGAAAGL